MVNQTFFSHFILHQFSTKPILEPIAHAYYFKNFDIIISRCALTFLPSCGILTARGAGSQRQGSSSSIVRSSCRAFAGLLHQPSISRVQRAVVHTVQHAAYLANHIETVHASFLPSILSNMCSIVKSFGEKSRRKSPLELRRS